MKKKGILLRKEKDKMNMVRHNYIAQETGFVLTIEKFNTIADYFLTGIVCQQVVPFITCCSYKEAICIGVN